MKQLLFLTLILCLFTLASCKKTPVEKNPTSWKEVTLTGDAKIILNAVTDGKKLYCHGAYLATLVDSANKSSYISCQNPSLDRYPVHPKYFVYFNENKKGFYISSHQQMSQNSSGWAYLSDIDTSLIAFNAGSQRPIYQVGINDAAQVLVTAITSNNKFNFYLVSFRDAGDGTISVLLSSTKKLDLPSTGFIPGYVYSFGNNFFVQDPENNILYRIDQNGGSVPVVSNCWSPQMFRYQNKLYLLNNSSFWISNDDGLSFTEQYRYDANFNGYYFRVLNEKIFAFVPYSGVGVFEFTPNGFTIMPIKNKGLEDVHITALTYFNNKVYVSTTSGLYYLGWNDIQF